MSLFTTLFAAGSLVTLISGTPVPSYPLRMHRGDVKVSDSSFSPRLERRAADIYVTYTGTGDSWPSVDSWVSSFDDMFNKNKALMSQSCTQFGAADNTDDEIGDIYNAIQSSASSTGLDARFILAIAMQESGGCVRAPTTNYGVRNPGIMQSHDGTGTCNDDDDPQDPCPSASISQMISDGTAGTSAGDGLQQCVEQSGASDVSKYYKAARIYNSGSIAADGDLGQGVATHCYASDIANRLMGWVTATHDCCIGESGCTGADSSSSASRITSSPTVATSASAAPATSSAAAVSSAVPVSSAAPVVTPAAATSATLAASTTTAASGAASTAPGAASNCASYYSVQSGDVCDTVASKNGISTAELVSLNTGLDSGCSNLWLGYDYCVKAS